MHIHDEIDVGSPFYAPNFRPARPELGILGDIGAGPPALHKFDQTNFVQRFLSEAVESQQTHSVPGSLLPNLAPQNPQTNTKFDVNTFDLWGGDRKTRVRKLYQPMHFRFYLAACELRCLVPGLPAPSRSKVKKVELVIRRVALMKWDGIDPQEWAWINVPAPGAFPSPVPDAALQMAPRLTGNSRVWWPIPERQEELEGEQRFPMTRAHGAGLEEHALYFAFLPLASGEMYGPLRTLQGPAPAMALEDYDKKPVPSPLPKPLPAMSAGDAAAQPAAPLVPAPSNFPLRPATIQSFRDVMKGWLTLLGRLMGKQPLDGPRPKFEPPPIVDPVDPLPHLQGAWGYTVRCVATLEVAPGCVIEKWGPATPPAVIAPQFDPFGGRPTRIEIPSIKELAQLVPAGTDLQAEGGLNLSVGSAMEVQGKDGAVTGILDGKTDLCFFGIPLITICAYVMFMLALIIVLPIFSFLLLFKFCLGSRP